MKSSFLMLGGNDLFNSRIVAAVIIQSYSAGEIQKTSAIFFSKLEDGHTQFIGLLLNRSACKEFVNDGVSIVADIFSPQPEPSGVEAGEVEKRDIVFGHMVRVGHILAFKKAAPVGGDKLALVVENVHRQVRGANKDHLAV